MLMPNPIIQLLLTVIQIYNYVLWAWFIMSWLISFNIINRHQPIVQRLNFALFRLTEPLLRPIRKYMPDLGGLDISPIILILLMHFVQDTLLYYSYR